MVDASAFRLVSFGFVTNLVSIASARPEHSRTSDRRCVQPRGVENGTCSIRNLDIIEK